MRVALAVTCLALGSALALAQVDAPVKPGDSQHSTGRTVSPAMKGEKQPQGATGPTETTTGGAPAESPQGQTPPGMQAAPEGSDKTVVDPDASRATQGAQSPPPGVLRSATSQPSDGIFSNGVLAFPGVDPDNQTAPAKFSKRTDTADQLAIAGYALRHLSDVQRSSIFQALHKPMAISNGKPAVDPTVGAEITSDIALHSLRALPEEITRGIPELAGLAYVLDGNTVVLASPTMQRVLAVIEK